MRVAIGLTLLATGCTAILESHFIERLDADDDGVPFYEDCLDDDAHGAEVQELDELVGSCSDVVLTCRSGSTLCQLTREDRRPIRSACVDPVDSTQVLPFGEATAIIRMGRIPPGTDVRVSIQEGGDGTFATTSPRRELMLMANRGFRCVEEACVLGHPIRGVPLDDDASPPPAGSASVSFLVENAEPWSVLVSGKPESQFEIRVECR